MDDNTGYIITDQNASLIATLSGLTMKTILANKGWVAHFKEDRPGRKIALLPKNVAERIRGFQYVDSPLNGLPARKEKDIRAEWAEVNKKYAEDVERLQKELERAKLRDEVTNGSNDQAQVSKSDATTDA